MQQSRLLQPACEVWRVVVSLRINDVKLCSEFVQADWLFITVIRLCSYYGQVGVCHSVLNRANVGVARLIFAYQFVGPMYDTLCGRLRTIKPQTVSTGAEVAIYCKIINALGIIGFEEVCKLGISSFTVMIFLHEEDVCFDYWRLFRNNLTIDLERIMGDKVRGRIILQIIRKT